MTLQEHYGYVQGRPGSEKFRCRARKSHEQVFGDEILAGICLLVIDKRFVGGDTFDEAIDNFERVLSKIHENKLKLIGLKIAHVPLRH